MLFGHGDDVGAGKDRVVGNFSSNVWYDGYCNDLKQVVVAAIEQISCYPEPDAHSLRMLLAAKRGVGITNVVATNGAIEGIYLIAQLFSGSRSLVVVPTFSEYEDACKLYNHSLSYINEACFDGAIPTAIDVVWICNPNNPTGRVWNRSFLLDLIARNPHKMFVVDQSYQTFYEGELLHESDVLAYPNLVVIGSLTKCYAIPGIRVGYVVASSQVVEQMLNIRIPWSVNALAVAVASYFLENEERYKLPLSRWMSDKHRLVADLAEVDYLEVASSETPFFLAKLRKGSSAELKSYLLCEHKLLIRDASNFRGLDSSFIRISPQQSSINALLVNALKQWMYR